MAEARRRVGRGRSFGDRTYGGPGFALVERTLKTIDRFKMLDGGEKIVVAVSGGPDSTCLLDVLARLEDKLDVELLVGHVDHALSPESEAVAARLASAAAEAGFEVHVARAPDLQGPNLQARARDFRYGFLEVIADKEGASKIATAHTLDDRVETTLARLIHGAGTGGLAGIPAVEGRRIRPLFDSRRDETRAYCLECDLEFYDDPANDDERFERVSVRKHLVAAIEERWGSGGVRAVATSAERLSEDAGALQSLAERIYEDIAKVADETVRFEIETLVGLSRAFRRRVIEIAVGRVRDRSGGIEAVLDALEGLVPGQNVKSLSFSVASGIEIRMDADSVIVERPG